MRIVERYISGSIIATFLMIMLVFSFLYVLIDSASNLDEFIKSQVSLGVLAQYYLSYLPVILTQTSTIAFLIAVLFTYTSLNSHNEVVVLRTSGLNFWRITKPALGLAVILAAIILLISERLVPQAEANAKRLKNENISSRIEQKTKKGQRIKNLTFYGLKNRLYYIDSFDPATFDIDGITIIGFDSDQNIKEKIIGLSGKWTGIAWKCYQCHVTSFPDPNDPAAKEKVTVYKEKLLDIKETPQDFMKQRINVDAMNIRQLNDYIIRFSDSGAKRALNNLRVDFHHKLAFPVANIIIVLAGLPLALTTGRRKALTFTSIGIAIGLGFLYHVCDAVGLALGKGGLFPPFLSAWMAPMIFSVLAAYLIRTKF